MQAAQRCPVERLPAAAAAPAEEPPTESDRVVDTAIKMIAKIQSVAAKLAQSVEMHKQKFTIKGEYKRAPNARVRLQLTVAGLQDSDGTTLQVCDGETLWEYQQILDRSHSPSRQLALYKMGFIRLWQKNFNESFKYFEQSAKEPLDVPWVSPDGSGGGAVSTSAGSTPEISERPSTASNAAASGSAEAAVSVWPSWAKPEMRSTVTCWRWPLRRRLFCRRRFLKMMTLSRRSCVSGR